MSHYLKLRKFVEDNIDKINWTSLSINPNAIQILKENQDKIHWGALSTNQNAITLLEQNQDKIDWIHYHIIWMRFIYSNKIKIKYIGDGYQEIQMQYTS